MLIQEKLSAEQALAEADSEVKNTKILADAEEQDNELEFKRRKGDMVVYGQVVQLLHVESRRMLRSSSSVTSKLEPR